jgi:tetratricopeptide (TPR) repeat protein
VLSALGQIERRLTGPEAAREALARELALRDRLAAVSPECQEEALALCDTLNRLGDVEAELGQYSAARAYYARSLEIGEQVYQVSGGPEAAEPLCTALDGLELVELAQGHDEAARGFRVRCDELRRRILEAQPAHSVNAREVCRRLVEAGEEDVRDGRLATARGQLTRAAALLQRVMGAAEDPDEDAAVLLRVLELLSDLEEREGRWAVAAEARAKYAALLQNLARRDADDTLLRDVWLDAMGRVAELWSRAEQLETAREECARWVEAVRQAHRWDPGNAKLRLALSRSLEKLGTIELDRGRPGAAREALKEALDLARQDDGSDSETRLTPRDLASLHWNVGRSCVRDRPDAADASFRQCLALLEGIERSDERLDAEAVRVLGWLREHFAPAPAAELLPERPPVFRRLRARFGV